MVNYTFQRGSIRLEPIEVTASGCPKKYEEILSENNEEFKDFFENGYLFKKYIYDMNDFTKLYISKETDMDPKRSLQNFWLDIISFAEDNPDAKNSIENTLSFTWIPISHFIYTEAITRFQNQLNDILYDAIVYDILWIKEHPEYILLSESHKRVFWELYEEIKRRMDTRIVRWETEVDTISDGNMGLPPGWGLDSPNPFSDPEPWPPNKFPTMESLEGKDESPESWTLEKPEE